MTVSYDAKNDILAIHKGFSSDEKFKSCIDAGDLILDVSTKGRIRGVEIIDASSFLKMLDINREILENIADAELNAEIRHNSVVVSIIFNGSIPAKFLVPIEQIAC